MSYLVIVCHKDDSRVSDSDTSAGSSSDLNRSFLDPPTNRAGIHLFLQRKLLHGVVAHRLPPNTITSYCGTSSGRFSQSAIPMIVAMIGSIRPRDFFFTG